MTLVPLLAAALLICTASSLAQEQPSSTALPNPTAEPERSTRVTTSDLWNLDMNQTSDTSKNSLQWQRLDAMSVRADARAGDDPVCYKIRSYVVARDSKDSDSVHPVGYSTCRPSSRYRLRKTHIHSD